MRILVTNDDGIHSEGLYVLEKIAKTISDDVWVVSSETDQSGTSHSLTLREPLRIRHVVDKTYAVTGTPTDCVLLAHSHLMKDIKPDLIVSGINYGPNLAEDVTYSGTIAAAMEGVLLNIPSVAFSLNVHYLHPPLWDTVLHFGPLVLQKFVQQVKLPQHVLLNVNFPNKPVDEIKGFKVVKHGHRQGSDEMIVCEDPRGKPYYWMGNALYRYDMDVATLEEDSDLKAVQDDYISLTPLSVDLTHYASLQSLQNIFV